MRTDLPELRRCCCCIPLRYGLLTFGYLKLIFAIPLIGLLFFMLNWSVMMYKSVFISIWDVLIPAFFTLLVLLDTALTIVFLVGGHQKSVKLLRVYYIYNIVIMLLGAAVLILMCVLQSMMYVHFGSHDKHGFVLATSGIIAEVLATVANIGFEIYFILLLRSEINKLKNSYNFRFINHAAEQCTIENGSAPQEDDEQHKIPLNYEIQ